MAKVYSKVNWATNTQASVQSLDKMDVGIDAIDLKTQNLPNDGSFNPTVQDITLESNARVSWLNMASGYYYIGEGVNLGYPQNYILVKHSKRNSVLAYQQIFHTNGIWTRILNTNDNSVEWTRFTPQPNQAPRTYILKGKLPQTTWQNAITHTLPTEFQNYPIVLSAYYKNANSVWIPATPADFSVMTGGNGSYLNIQTSGTSVVGLDFEVTIMSRSNAQVVTI